MAIFVFKMKTFSRAAGSRGSRATSAAAYRAGERIRDERTGAIYDHRGRRDVLHREIVLPAALAASPPSWTQARAALWNAAERAEPRSNARVAREFMVVLPHELGDETRLQLARGLAQQISARYGNAVDLVLHAPRHDPRNFHAHLLTTTREVHEHGFGRKTDLELNGTRRHELGLLRWSEERIWLRERWADLTNQALKEASLDARVSAQYPRQRGQSLRLPSIAYHIEKRGGHSTVAARLRAQHQAQHAPELEPERAHAASGWLERKSLESIERWRALRETWKAPDAQESFRNWLEYRQRAAAATQTPGAPDQQVRRKDLEQSHGVDLDFSL